MPFPPIFRLQILDHGGNIVAQQYWEQDTLLQTPRPVYVNLTITARISSVDKNQSNFASVPFGAGPITYLPPYFMQSDLSSIVATLFGTVSITILTDPSASQFCPGECSGRGSCLQGSCQCSDGWSGADCMKISSQKACSFSYFCPTSPGWLSSDGDSCNCTSNTTSASSPIASVVFTDLAIDLASWGYILIFEASGLAPVWTLSFSVSVGNATHLWVLAQPRGGFGGQVLGNSPVLQVQNFDVYTRNSHNEVFLDR